MLNHDQFPFVSLPEIFSFPEYRQLTKCAALQAQKLRVGSTKPFEKTKKFELNLLEQLEEQLFSGLLPWQAAGTEQAFYRLNRRHDNIAVDLTQGKIKESKRLIEIIEGCAGIDGGSEKQSYWRVFGGGSCLRTVRWVT
ncbi:MAG: hypothetical protein J5J00_03505 [Deltaproteobacteria bacterium]|nr:hypothetical protein [Deltaproteobacteria bacterium]